MVPHPNPKAGAAPDQHQAHLPNVQVRGGLTDVGHELDAIPRRPIDIDRIASGHMQDGLRPYQLNPPNVAGRAGGRRTSAAGSDPTRLEPWWSQNNPASDSQPFGAAQPVVHLSAPGFDGGDVAVSHQPSATSHHAFPLGALTTDP